MATTAPLSTGKVRTVVSANTICTVVGIRRSTGDQVELPVLQGIVHALRSNPGKGRQASVYYMQERVMQQKRMNNARFIGLCSVLALGIAGGSSINAARAEQPQPPCHPNPNATADESAVRARGDIVNLPDLLKDRLAQLANRPHTYPPMQAFAEADAPSQLFQYYLLDTTGFEPNVFTAIIPGVNDANVEATATGANCGLPAVGAVRLVLEPKPDLPTDPNDPGAFIDVFTDISPLFVINNESGWYEGWMIHDITVPNIAPSRPDGRAAFGTITDGDAKLLAKMGPGYNVPGHIFTLDGQAPRFPSASDKFPDKQTNVVPLQESMGAYNAMLQSDVHSYWEFNYLGTNWIHPLYELPFTGGFPDNFGQPPDAFEDGEIGKLQSIVPGPGPFCTPRSSTRIAVGDFSGLIASRKRPLSARLASSHAHRRPLTQPAAGPIA